MTVTSLSARASWKSKGAADLAATEYGDFERSGWHDESSLVGNLGSERSSEVLPGLLTDSCRTVEFQRADGR